MSHHTDEANCPLCEEKLKTAHVLLHDWYRAKKAKYANLHISCAWRNSADQEQAFKEGKTRCHYPKSPHNRMSTDNKPESLALDLFLLDEDGVARFTTQFYKKLSDECKAAREPIVWGGDFKSLGDADHFQIQLVQMATYPSSDPT